MLLVIHNVLTKPSTIIDIWISHRLLYFTGILVIYLDCPYPQTLLPHSIIMKRPKYQQNSHNNIYKE